MSTTGSRRRLAVARQSHPVAVLDHQVQVELDTTIRTMPLGCARRPGSARPDRSGHGARAIITGQVLMASAELAQERGRETGSAVDIYIGYRRASIIVR